VFLSLVWSALHLLALLLVFVYMFIKKDTEFGQRASFAIFMVMLNGLKTLISFDHIEVLRGNQVSFFVVLVVTICFLSNNPEVIQELRLFVAGCVLLQLAHSIYVGQLLFENRTIIKRHVRHLSDRDIIN